MFDCCESLQDQCRRVLIRSVGSRKLLHKLPLPKNIIEWLKNYEEPTVFDPNCSTDEVVFSNNNETITFTGRGYSTTLIFTPYGRGFSRGKHEWVFYLDNCRGQVAVCLVPSEFKKARSFRTMPATSSRKGWAYNQIGLFTFEGPIWDKNRHRAESYQSWDMIGLLLDLDKGTLGFMKNGKELGTAFCKNLCGKEVFPGVCLCSGREKVTYISSRTYL